MCDPVGVIDKATLRKRMRQALDLIDDRELRSVELWSRLAELPAYTEARTVMAFASMANEPDTEGLFARLARDGKVLVLPRMEGDVIVPVVMTGASTVGRWEIREPVGPAIDPATIDLVVVPGVSVMVGRMFPKACWRWQQRGHWQHDRSSSCCRALSR